MRCYFKFSVKLSLLFVLEEGLYLNVAILYYFCCEPIAVTLRYRFDLKKKANLTSAFFKNAADYDPLILAQPKVFGQVP